MKTQHNFPIPLCFYYFNGAIYFNTTLGEGIKHPELWRKLVMKVFGKLEYESRIELCQDCYGTERGRLVFLPESESWNLFGTPGCEEVANELISNFGLTGKNFKTDFKTDLHYRTNLSQVKSVSHALKLIKLTKPPELIFIELD